MDAQVDKRIKKLFSKPKALSNLIDLILMNRKTGKRFVIKVNNKNIVIEKTGENKIL